MIHVLHIQNQAGARKTVTDDQSTTQSELSFEPSPSLELSPAFAEAVNELII